MIDVFKALKDGKVLYNASLRGYYWMEGKTLRHKNYYRQTQKSSILMGIAVNHEWKEVEEWKEISPQEVFIALGEGEEVLRGDILLRVKDNVLEYKNKTGVWCPSIMSASGFFNPNYKWRVKNVI